MHCIFVPLGVPSHAWLHGFDKYNVRIYRLNLYTSEISVLDVVASGIPAQDPV